MNKIDDVSDYESKKKTDIMKAQKIKDIDRL